MSRQLQILHPRPTVSFAITAIDLESARCFEEVENAEPEKTTEILPVGFTVSMMYLPFI